MDEQHCKKCGRILNNLPDHMTMFENKVCKKCFGFVDNKAKNQYIRNVRRVRAKFKKLKQYG